jgi:4-hydroxy-tetrahydrodipicolinate synthase
MEFPGVYTALVTPFREGRLDEEAFRRLIEWQVAGGVRGVVAVGTTGESPTLSNEEHLRVIGLAVEAAAGRLQVMAGTGANSTAEAIYLTQAAEQLGAHASLQVAPYYNKPTQAGLLAHFSAIAAATKLPLMLYNVPSRCGVDIGVETVVRLAAEVPNIVALKEAGGSVERVSQLRQVLPSIFPIYCGDDGLTLPFLSVGATGVISVASNLIPREVSALVLAATQGRHREAEEIHRRCYPLFRDLFIESNPVPIKFALARLGWMTPEVRLPLVPLAPAHQLKLTESLASFPLINQ